MILLFSNVLSVVVKIKLISVIGLIVIVVIKKNVLNVVGIVCIVFKVLGSLCLFFK